MSPRKTQKLRTFVKLDKKPVAQKGIQYSFENVGVVSDIPGLKGDIVKKYVNGKLKEQKFVTRDKLRKFVQTATRKEQKRFMGGEIANNKIAKNKPAKKVLVQNNANLQKLLAEQKNQQLLERQVVAQENMVKAAETGNNLDKGFLGLIAIAIGIEVFDH